MTGLAFAHYFTPYPISFDNAVQPDQFDTLLIAPGGEKGIHAAYGGMLRDRPIRRAPLPNSDWASTDMQTEVRRAIAGGLDGFTLDLFGGTGATSTSVNVTRQKTLIAASAAVSSTFKIMLMPDMSNWAAGATSTNPVMSPSAFATRINDLYTSPGASTSLMKLGDGRLVIAPYFAEKWTASQWTAALNAAQTAIGVGIALVPCFLNYTSNISAFMAIPHMYGAASWGNRNPSAQTGEAAKAADAHSRGLIWMQPVSVQDERPNQAKFWESKNTQNLRDSWGAAMGKTGGVAGTPVANGVADWVQFPTWNDFSEGAQLCPSDKHGWTYLNLSKHYLTWWKTGTEPTPTQDVIYLTHRTQPWNATPTGGQTSLMAVVGSDAPQDTVEVVTELTGTATLTIKVGANTYTQTRTAGVSVGTTVPLAVGTVSATISMSGQQDLTVISPTPVTNSPVVQDLQYVAVTAARSPVVPRLLGINDAAKPTGLLDTLEGAYSAGAGTGISNRIPVVHVINGWSSTSTAFGSSSREKALFDAGHDILVSFRAPSTYAEINAGTDDAVIDALGDRIYALGFGAAVSGTQPGQTYGGTKPVQVRISFMPQADADTTRGTATEFKTAWRRVMGRLKARKPGGAVERIVCVPIFTLAAQGNGQALNFYPGNTAADFCDEVGVNGNLASTATGASYISFATMFAPWFTWITANAPARKLFVAQTAAHPDPANAGAQAQWIADMGTTLVNDTRFSGACWWSPDAYTTSDDRVIQKAMNPTLWTAFHDAVANILTGGAPPPDVTPPAVPTGLSATTTTSTSVTLTWNAPTDPDLAGFQLLRDGAAFQTIASPATTTYTVSGQTAGSSHAYQVASYDDKSPANVSAFSTSLTVVHPSATAPNPPAIGSSSVTMTNSTAAATVTATDPALGALVYVWTWGDLNSDTGATATHTYSTPGTYTVTLTVTSSTSGLSTSQTFTKEALPDPANVTPFLGLALPAAGQHPGAFGPNFRANFNRIDQAVQAASSAGLTPTGVKTAAYTAAAGDFVPVDTTGGAVTISLPAAPADRAQVLVYLKAFTVGNFLTVAASGTDVVESSTGTVTSMSRTAGTGQQIWVQYDQSNALWRQLPDRLPLTLLDDRYGADLLTAGESNMRRLDASAAIGLTSGLIRFGYLTARKTEPVANIRVGVVAASSGTAPTLCKLAVYAATAATGDLTRVGVTASDTTMFASTGSVTKALLASFTKTAGVRYALAGLCVTTGTIPTLMGVGTSVAAELGLDPRLAASLSSQTDMPATITAASLADTANLPYYAITP